MRDMFRGYYQPTNDEIQAIWRDGLISLDANVLLSLYNVLPTTSALYLSAMEQRKPQMWIPYQVALEFHRNVHKERSKQTTAHQNRIKQIDGVLGDLRSTAKKSRLTASDIQQKAVDSLEALKEQLVAERDIIAEQTSHRTPDALLEQISGLFDGQVGAEPDKATLDAMFKEAENRFTQEIPPGFEDAKTKTGNRKYGDYVLWRQLMDHASVEKKDIIFVTDDDKADWWLKIEKMSVAPRPDLIQEFRFETGQNILILNSAQFYHHLVPNNTNDEKEEIVLAARQDMSDAVTAARAESLFERFLPAIPTNEEEALRERWRRLPADHSGLKADSTHRTSSYWLEDEDLNPYLRDQRARRRALVEAHDQLIHLRTIEAELASELEEDLDHNREGQLRMNLAEIHVRKRAMEESLRKALDDGD